MEKHCESGKRFGKEDGGTAAKNEVLESFIRESGKRAYQVAYNMAGNREEAKELVQETLYRAARHLGRYQTDKPLDRWFFAILRNTFLDGRRRLRRRRVVSLDAPVDGTEGDCLADFVGAEEESAFRGLERAETAANVRLALSRLDPKYQAVLRLCDMGGTNYDESARRLGLPPGTLRSRLSRARQAFRVQMTQVVIQLG